ncbi:hypothetical protein [Streptomyces flavalbus]|uniref:Caspase family protein n=1 Tax=Streptomyces flavalbus TaxID=2665155 RepID=A0ABW2WHY7_9ACTN
MLFLDCCYGGAFSQGPTSVRAAADAHVLDSFAGENLGGGRGWAVITASNSMEYAFEGSDLAEGSAPRPRPSLFTHAVVQGLATGEADLDQDGLVALDELYEYVFDHVRQQNPNQTPSRTVDMQGDMYLARSHRRRITPAPVPEDVRAAMRSPDLYTRRGAIAELRARMENRDLPIAAGAREALAEMVRNDIRFIADEAQRALDEVAINPHPVRLDFGAVPQGAPAPRQTVRLLGPPLARSCVPHPKADWLRATPTDDGLDVRVTTATPGRLSGDVVLKGAVGEAVVHVTAEVRSKDQPEAHHRSPPPPPRDADPTRPLDVPPPPPKPPPPRPAPTPKPPPPPRPDPTPKPPPQPPPKPPPQPSPKPPPRPVPGPAPTPPTPRVPAGARRAPVLAAAALALAVTSVFLLVRTAVAAAEVGRNLSADGTLDAVTVHAADAGLVAPMVVALVTSVAALALRALARYELRTRPGRYPRSAEHTTRALVWTTALLAVPVAVLALLLSVGYLVLSNMA